MKIKICGLQTRSDIDAVNNLLPDYIGFVFAKKSKRYITPAKAKLLSSFLSSKIKIVGVFVDEPIENVFQLLQGNIIDIAQLHGKEDENYISSLKATLKNCPEKKIIKAFSVTCPNDLIVAEASSADYVLLDAGTGGTGKTFNWQLIRNFQRPYFLAGGLSPTNVQTAVNKLHPFGVDVSSGVETDGKKNPEKINAFISAIATE